MTREQFRPADHPNDHFLLTTVVGSYPKPSWLDRLHEQYHGAKEAEESNGGSNSSGGPNGGASSDGPMTRDAGRSGDAGPSEDFESHSDSSDYDGVETTRDVTIDAETLAEAEDDASRLIVREHERMGLDVVVDGEMRRTEMVEYFARRIDGYDFPGMVKVWGHNYFDKPRVVDELSYTGQWVVDERGFAASVADSPVKTCLTGPYTMANFSFDEVYGDDAELALALADLANQEVRALVDAGARYIQIDEPGLGTTPEDHAIVGECLEKITTGVPDDVRIGLHVCYGDYSRFYPEVLDFPIDELDIEMVNDGFDQLDVFREPDFDMDVAFGVVDAHDSSVETVTEIKRNIRKGLEAVPPDQLTVSPDCGLKLLPREVAFRKTEHMVQAAREVEAELDEERA